MLFFITCNNSITAAVFKKRKDTSTVLDWKVSSWVLLLSFSWEMDSAQEKGPISLNTVISGVAKSCITFAVLHKMMDYINRASKAVDLGFSWGKNKTTLELSCNCYLCNSTLINVLNKLHVLQDCFSTAKFQCLLLNITFSELMQHVFASTSPYFYITVGYVSQMSCDSFPSVMAKRKINFLFITPIVASCSIFSLCSFPQTPLLLWGGASDILKTSELHFT